MEIPQLSAKIQQRIQEPSISSFQKLQSKNKIKVESHNLDTNKQSNDDDCNKGNDIGKKYTTNNNEERLQFLKRKFKVIRRSSISEIPKANNEPNDFNTSFSNIFSKLSNDSKNQNINPKDHYIKTEFKLNLSPESINSNKENKNQNINTSRIDIFSNKSKNDLSLVEKELFNNKNINDKSKLATSDYNIKDKEDKEIIENTTSQLYDTNNLLLKKMLLNSINYNLYNNISNVNSDLVDIPNRLNSINVDNSMLIDSHSKKEYYNFRIKNDCFTLSPQEMQMISYYNERIKSNKELLDYYSKLQNNSNKDNEDTNRKNNNKIIMLKRRIITNKQLRNKIFKSRNANRSIYTYSSAEEESDYNNEINVVYDASKGSIGIESIDEENLVNDINKNLIDKESMEKNISILNKTTNSQSKQSKQSKNSEDFENNTIKTEESNNTNFISSCNIENKDNYNEEDTIMIENKESIVNMLDIEYINTGSNYLKALKNKKTDISFILFKGKNNDLAETLLKHENINKAINIYKQAARKLFIKDYKEAKILFDSSISALDNTDYWFKAAMIKSANLKIIYNMNPTQGVDYYFYVINKCQKNFKPKLNNALIKACAQLNTSVNDFGNKVNINTDNNWTHKDFSQFKNLILNTFSHITNNIIRRKSTEIISKIEISIITINWFLYFGLLEEAYIICDKILALISDFKFKYNKKILQSSNKKRKGFCTKIAVLNYSSGLDFKDEVMQYKFYFRTIKMFISNRIMMNNKVIDYDRSIINVNSTNTSCSQLLSILNNTYFKETLKLICSNINDTTEYYKNIINRNSRSSFPYNLLISCTNNMMRLLSSNDVNNTNDIVSNNNSHKITLLAKDLLVDIHNILEYSLSWFSFFANTTNDTYTVNTKSNSIKNASIHSNISFISEFIYNIFALYSIKNRIMSFIKISDLNYKQFVNRILDNTKNNIIKVNIDNSSKIIFLETCYNFLFKVITNSEHDVNKKNITIQEKIIMINVTIELLSFLIIHYFNNFSNLKQDYLGKSTTTSNSEFSIKIEDDKEVLNTDYINVYKYIAYFNHLKQLLSMKDKIIKLIIIDAPENKLYMSIVNTDVNSNSYSNNYKSVTSQIFDINNQEHIDNDKVNFHKTCVNDSYFKYSISDIIISTIKSKFINYNSNEDINMMLNIIDLFIKSISNDSDRESKCISSKYIAFLISSIKYNKNYRKNDKLNHYIILSENEIRHFVSGYWDKLLKQFRIFLIDENLNNFIAKNFLVNLKKNYDDENKI